MSSARAEPQGFALEARHHFLLLRQKKVSKEKATPGYAAGFTGSPALLATGGGCGTRGYAPQTVLAPFPPVAALLGAPHGDRKNVSGTSAFRSFESSSWPRTKSITNDSQSAASVFPAPLRGAEQRRQAGSFRLALSEPQASLASRPACRVAQGTGHSPAPTQGSPFLWLLSFGEAKESTPASKAETQRQSMNRSKSTRHP
jgi:hypothetical protein